MNYDLILSNIGKHISLNEAERNFFCSLLKEKKISKKDLVLTEGQLCRNISFVNAGILSAFFNHEGKESTIMFAMQDWWITDINCFINQQSAMLNIVALEETEVLQLSKENMDKLLQEFPKFEKFFRIIFQNAYVREQLRTIQNLSLPAAERYDNFCAKYERISKMITQKQIASYLGITPEFLSVIRAKRANSK